MTVHAASHTWYETPLRDLRIQRFDVLDSWRGIAACMVALFHLEVNSHIDNLSFIRNSWLFVDFFFVLSGFVIAANYQRRLLDGFGFWRFVLLRFGRLYPLHLFVLAVFLGLKAIQAQVPVLSSVARNQPFSLRDSPVAIAANLLLIQGMGVLDFLSFNIPSWSVSTEFWAYIAFGTSLVLLRNSARSLLVAVVVLAPIFLYDKVGHIDTTYDYGFVRCIFGFSLGALSWAFFNRFKARRLGTTIEVATVACVIYFVSASGRTGITLIAPFVFAVTVLVFACESGRISAALSQPAFLKIGELSYSIYMLHFLVAGRFTDVARLLRHFGFHTLVQTRQGELIGLETWQGDLLTIVYLAVVIVGAGLTFRFVEEPSRRWFRGLAAERAVQPAA